MSTNQANQQQASMDKSLDSIDRELTRIASLQVIRKAAVILEASHIDDSTAESYVIIGYNKLLMHADEITNATKQEIASYRLWCCSKSSGIHYDDLTLVEVIKYLLGCPDVYENGNPFWPREEGLHNIKDEDYDEEDYDEAVTIEDVLACIGAPALRQQALAAARIELDANGKNGALIIRALETLPE